MPNQPTKPSEDLIGKVKGRESYTSICQHLRGDRKGVLTWGYGQTGCKLGAYISEPDANTLLRERLQSFASGVNRLVKVDLTQNQYDALTDFAYNVGLGQLSKSTLLRLLNAGDYDGADNEFDKWDMADGVVLSGLLTRREEETDQFEEPDETVNETVAGNVGTDSGIVGGDKST